MLDWQLAETVKVNPQNPVLRDQLATVSAKYERDDHYGKPGSWARLPTGKKYYNFETRKRHVLKELEDENPPVELGAEVWQFIRDEARAQRALTNTTVHASPLAVSTIDDYVAMAIQGALYAVLTVATYRRISDDEILENFPALSAGKDSLSVRAGRHCVAAGERSGVTTRQAGPADSVRRRFVASGSRNDAQFRYIGRRR